MKIIITTSGTGSRLDKITQYTNKSLVKIGDKFAIDYIIDNYKNIDGVEFIITVGYYADFVKQYIDIAYKNKIKYKFVEIDNYDKPGSSLLYSLSKTRDFVKCPFIFHCCDTIIQENFINNELINQCQNVLFVNDYKNSSQYATITKNLQSNDNAVLKINEKGAKQYDFIYIGVAYIYDYSNFWNIVDELLDDTKDSSLSDIHVYKKMLKTKTQIFYREIGKYNDIGNIISYENASVNIKRKYNVIDKLTESISFLDDMVVKWFYDKDKTRKYIDRTKYICSEHIPEIYSHCDNFVSMELINSPPLSEIYEHGKIYELLKWADKNLWISDDSVSSYDFKPLKITNGTPEVFPFSSSRVVTAGDVMGLCPITNLRRFKISCRQFYYDKTISRVQHYLNNKQHHDFHIINGIEVGSIYDIVNKIDYDWLCDVFPYKFHGDFVLDNILYKNDKFILIDWREDFGGRIDVGDKYYDLAKLKHNMFFNHKNITNRLFDFEQNSKDSCIVDMKCNYSLIKQLADFDRFVVENKLDNKKIDVIQGLIWINMAALYEPPLSNMLFHIGKLQVYLSIS